ncbi:hypothetical protein HXX76_008358 [Chlamydomonas incerta]|uniref:Uncharacterized protein n=1 Tax=Chlamydomonas incerta TaxID=51695 RepID=A0A835SWY9_CHLIN|nr:hypothetical protein HXX76_008358 [Chlamydomonas incerta]|eukprot:KAG2433291.1 hypothetical protein HXX76_008358 [Chlamydomonas incerta]
MSEYCLELREVRGAPPSCWLVLEVIVRTPRLLTTVRRKYASKPFHASAARGVVVQWLRPSAAAKALVRLKLVASHDGASLGDAGDVAAAASDGTSELHKSSAADVLLPLPQPLQQGPEASAAAASAPELAELQCARVQLQVPPDAIVPSAADAGAGLGLDGANSNGGGHGSALPLELELELYYVVRPATAFATAAAPPAEAGAIGATGAGDGGGGWVASGGHAAAWGQADASSAVPPTPSTAAKKRTWLSALGFSRSGSSAAGSGQADTDAARSAGSQVATAGAETAAGQPGGAPGGTAAMDLRTASSAAAAGLTGAWSVSSSVPTPAGASAPSGAGAAVGGVGSFGRAEAPSGRWQPTRPSLPSAISSAGRGPTTFAAAAAAVMSATGMAPPAQPQPQPQEARAAGAGLRLLTAPLAPSGSLRSDAGDTGATPTTAGGLMSMSSSVARGSTPKLATPMALSSRPSSTLPPESQPSQQMLQPPKRRRLGDFFARLFGTSNHGHGSSHAAAANGNGGARGRAAGADGAASASAAGAAAAAGTHAMIGTTAAATATSAGASPHSTGSLRRYPSLTNLAPLVPPSPRLGDVYRIQDNALASEGGVQVGFGSMTSAFQQAPGSASAQQLAGCPAGLAGAGSGRLPSGPLQHSGGSGGAGPLPMQIQPSASASLPGLESPGAYAGELSPAYHLPPGAMAVEPPTGGLAAASLVSPAAAAAAAFGAAAAAAAAAASGAGRGGAGGAWAVGKADGVQDVAMQASGSGEAAAGDLPHLPHLPQPSPMATSPGAPPGGCFLFWRYGSATVRKQQLQQLQLQPSQRQPASDESPAAAMGRAAGLHSGPASGSGVGRNPAQLSALGRLGGGPSSASAASTPTHMHPGQHYLDQHGAGPRGRSGAGAVPPGFFGSTSVNGEGTEGGAGGAGAGRAGPLSAGAGAAAGFGPAVAAEAGAGAAVAAAPHPLEAEVSRVMAWVTAQTGAGGMEDDVRVSAISQCQFLLDCLHNPDMSWLVPDSLLQLKHEVGFPFDSGVPIAGAPGWYRLVLQPMQLPQPQQSPQQLASPRSGEAEQQQEGAAASAGAGDGHGALPVPAVTRPLSMTGCSAAAAAARQQPEVLKVRWSAIDQRAAGGANACAAIALEVALWCLAAMQRWRAATSAAAAGSGGAGQHERRGSGSGSGHGGSGGAAFAANGRTSSFEHHTSGSASGAAGGGGGGGHSRGLLPVLSRSARERIAGAAGIDMDAMGGGALEAAIRTGTNVWMGLLATSPAARVASSTGDFDLEHMLQLGGYGERLRLSEYIAATLIQPPAGGDAGAAGAAGAAGGPGPPRRRMSRDSGCSEREEAASRRASRDGPGPGQALAEGAGGGSEAVAAMAAAAAAGCGAGMGSRPGAQQQQQQQQPLPSSPPQGSLMFPSSLPLPLTPLLPPHDSPAGVPGSLKHPAPQQQRSTPGSEAREAPGTGGSAPGSHPRPPRPPRPPPLLTCASPDGGQPPPQQHMPHPPPMPTYRVSQNGVPYFASLVRSLQQGVYVLGVHGHFTTLWLRPGGTMHVIDSLGARLAADCPLGFIAEFDCAADFLAFFLARHGVRGQAAAADADDISGGNLAALVEVHRLELTAVGVAAGAAAGGGCGAGGVGLQQHGHRH